MFLYVYMCVCVCSVKYESGKCPWKKQLREFDSLENHSQVDLAVFINDFLIFRTKIFKKFIKKLQVY